MVAEKTTSKPRLQELYETTVAPKVMSEFKIANVHQLPRLERIIVSCGIGRYLENQKLKQDIHDTVVGTLTTITGQKPILIRAKKSVSNFKVREGSPSAFMVTLRRRPMWHFYDRLVNLAIPRIKDFRGVNDRSFDQAGNYGMGLTEQAVWPEINVANITFQHGMNINMIFERSTPEISKFVLAELGMPFVRSEAEVA